MGPKYSLIASAEQSISGPTIEGTNDIRGDLQDYFGGVLGFGSYLAGSDALSINLGLRLSYAFSDMISAKGRVESQPQTDFGPMFDEYKSTNPLTGQIYLEVNYVFGRIAKQSCSGRKKLILF